MLLNHRNSFIVCLFWHLNVPSHVKISDSLLSLSVSIFISLSLHCVHIFFLISFITVCSLRQAADMLFASLDKTPQTPFIMKMLFICDYLWDAKSTLGVYLQPYAVIDYGDLKGYRTSDRCWSVSPILNSVTVFSHRLAVCSVIAALMRLLKVI